MAIGQNKVVSMNFTLKDENGNIIQATNAMEPFQFLSGNQQILPRLEEEIENMLIGSKKNIKIPAKEAYGEYNEESVQELSKNNFPKDVDLEIGMEFISNSPKGEHMPFVVKEINNENVTIDFNHPLAGINLEFNIELLDVRDA
ncbi:MAG TPA: peptidylprolyl isomerase, partial [Ignavibacteriaceae bacterium]|nr:peptidylprolyl isomerase [Ignavibacteriaceae bacterium]